jgi:adenine C2-methylase RlmN of 23S rRNA A2503 and tRNA A37
MHPAHPTQPHKDGLRVETVVIHHGATTAKRIKGEPRATVCVSSQVADFVLSACLLLCLSDFCLSIPPPILCIFI